VLAFGCEVLLESGKVGVVAELTVSDIEGQSFELDGLRLFHELLLDLLPALSHSQLSLQVLLQLLYLPTFPLRQLVFEPLQQQLVLSHHRLITVQFS
jgi:hypothetical protein